MLDPIAVSLLREACGHSRRYAAGHPGCNRPGRTRGVIIKGGLPLELLAHVDTACFLTDGHLTYGSQSWPPSGPALV